MTAGTSTNSDGLRSDRLYRSADQGVIAGVCAGLARYFGIDVTLTRVIVAVAAFFFPILVLVYIVLAFVVPKQPRSYVHRDGVDDELAQRVRTEPHATLNTVRHRFRDLERRLQRLEKHVTSKRYNLEREFDNLKDQ